MSRYAERPLDLAALRTVPLRARGGKVRAADFAAPYVKGAGLAGWLEGCPTSWPGDGFRSVVDAIWSARERGKPVIWGLGGHVIKCGLAPVLADLMRRGYATAFAMNGAAAIHDFEIALAGHTSEDVEAVLPDGSFGSAEETGREMNQAIARGARDGIGMGEALGRRLQEIADPAFTAASLLLEACRHAAPVTVHVAVGTDTPHTHPAADAAAIGRGHAPRFPPVLRPGGGPRRGRRVHQRRFGRGAAGGVPEGRFGGAQPGPPAARLHHREFRFPAALPAARERGGAAARAAPAAAGIAITGHHELMCRCWPRR